MSNQPLAIDLKQIVRRYGDDLTILDGANLAVPAGEMVALLGPSGSGKSSLLHVAGLLERPTSGQVIVDGIDTQAAGDSMLTTLRRDKIGFVYQFHHLLPEFTAQRNVEIPMLIAGVSLKEAAERAVSLLTTMGLAERLDHQPAQLSGGEKQRVAIARALANRPAVLLADEPTGNLDTETSHKVFDALMNIVRKEGLAAIVATHDRNLAMNMDRIVSIQARKLEQQEF